MSRITDERIKNIVDEKGVGIDNAYMYIYQGESTTLATVATDGGFTNAVSFPLVSGADGAFTSPLYCSYDGVLRVEVFTRNGSPVRGFPIFIDNRSNSSKTVTSGPYTLLASDAGRTLIVNSASNVDIDVAEDTFGVGDEVEIVRLGLGHVLVVAGSNVTVQGLTTLGGSARYAVIKLKCISDNNYVVYGDTKATTGAPTIASSVPADNATDVAVDTTIAITFSDGVKFGTGDVILKVVGGATVETFDVATGTGDDTPAGTITVVGRVVTITPGNDLSNATEYAIRIAATCVEDYVNDVAFAGIADDTTLSFTTVA